MDMLLRPVQAAPDCLQGVPSAKGPVQQGPRRVYERDREGEWRQTLSPSEAHSKTERGQDADLAAQR